MLQEDLLRQLLIESKAYGSLLGSGGVGDPGTIAQSNIICLSRCRCYQESDLKCGICYYCNARNKGLCCCSLTNLGPLPSICDKWPGCCDAQNLVFYVLGLPETLGAIQKYFWSQEWDNASQVTSAQYLQLWPLKLTSHETLCMQVR